MKSGSQTGYEVRKQRATAMRVSIDASGSVSTESEAQPAAQGIERVLVNTIVSNDAEGGRVFVARPRNISGTADAENDGEEGEGGAIFTARPRDINTSEGDAAPSEGAPQDLTMLGPKGLALPAWHPSMELDRARREAEAERRAQRQAMFGNAEYWDAYYADPSGAAGAEYTEEWYCSAEALDALLPSAPAPYQKALILGCGLSPLGETLHGKGYGVTCVDVSRVLLSHLEDNAPPYCTYALADARTLPFADGGFALVPLELKTRNPAP
ncbi:hypothetical protein T484DRAFT_3476076 [Baffinella frigidus]|nr:hypothetical protein T484DRAFT_3476076 [Cryptophyta sp. CCMP2293]